MKIINHYSIAFLLFLVLFTSENIFSQTYSQTDLVSMCILNGELWNKAFKESKPQSNLYILDHGVEFQIPQDFMVNDISVSLITKSEIPNVKPAPYFLFHTLKIEEQKAFVRLYLVYNVNDDEKTLPQELSFIKTNDEWLLINSSF